MPEPRRPHVFLSYSGDSEPFVESLALRLQGDARLAFWFGPWHSVPGEERLRQMDHAIATAEASAVFIGPSRRFEAWQCEATRAALERRVEGSSSFRVIPVLLPGASRPRRGDLPPFLRRFEPVEFRVPNDEQAYIRLLTGILGIGPGQLQSHLRAHENRARIPRPRSGVFERGHAVVVGISAYSKLAPLSESARNDAQDLRALLGDPARCGYPNGQICTLLDAAATADNIRKALRDLAGKTGPDDTVVLFFSGRATLNGAGAEAREHILPVDCDPDDMEGSALSGAELMSLLGSIKAGRLLVLLDAGHGGEPGLRASGGGEGGLRESFYQGIAGSRGRAVIASSRRGEVSQVLPGMRNSVFAHHLFEALRGNARTLGDGYVRAFDLFRHLAERIPSRARQQPLFKTGALEDDFAVALVRT